MRRARAEESESHEPAEIVYRTVVQMLPPNNNGEPFDLFDLTTRSPLDVPLGGQRFPLGEWQELAVDPFSQARLADVLSRDDLDRLVVVERERNHIAAAADRIVVETVLRLSADPTCQPSLGRQLEAAQAGVDKEAERFDLLLRLFKSTVRAHGRNVYGRCLERTIEAIRLERYGVADDEYKPKDGLEELAVQSLLGWETWDNVAQSVRDVVSKLDDADKVALLMNWNGDKSEVRDMIDNKASELTLGGDFVEDRWLSEVRNELIGDAVGVVRSTADRLRQRMESGEVHEGED